ncbi:PAS domain-containing protein, partial [Streptomyces sp. B1866]|uniref:PAS domain-containing protein n=1 Tax=Streptomyces sp. B1866 TaxID=3075431 RepID=UPI00288DC1DC
MGGRLRMTPAGPEGVSPNLLQGAGHRRPPQAKGPDNWSWDLRTGAFELPGPLLEELGVDPAVNTGWVEPWAAILHPDDLAWVAAEAGRAIRSRGAYELAYRVRRTDGTYAWVQSHGRVVVDEQGEPDRVVGRLWNATETHGALESVGRALLHMSDGFLSMSRDGRIGFVNAAAERLLGPAREMVGQLLWEVPVLRDVPEVAERCREAGARGEPVGFEVPGMGRDQWYNLR